MYHYYENYHTNRNSEKSLTLPGFKMVCVVSLCFSLSIHMKLYIHTYILQHVYMFLYQRVANMLIKIYFNFLKSFLFLSIRL